MQLERRIRRRACRLQREYELGVIYKVGTRKEGRVDSLINYLVKCEGISNDNRV